MKLKHLKLYENFENEEEDYFVGFDSLEELYELGSDLLDEAQEMLQADDYLDAGEAIEELKLLGTQDAIDLANQIENLEKKIKKLSE